LGIGDWAQSPIPNPQSPIPNPQINDKFFKFKISNKFIINFKYIFLSQKNKNKIYNNIF